MATGADDSRKLTAKAQETRERLVDAAARMFAERGYERTSVRALGDELGMTSGAIYTHFRSKADLLAAAVADAIAEQVERVPDPPSRTYREGAASLFARHPGQAAMRSLLLGATATAQGDEAVRDRLRAVQVERITRWAQSAARDQAAGKLAADIDAEALVKLLWALEFGLVLFDVFEIEPPDADTTSTVVRRLIGD